MRRLGALVLLRPASNALKLIIFLGAILVYLDQLGINITTLLAGLGVGGTGYTSLSIASPTGEGVTRARDFTRERRCTVVDYFRIV